MTPQAEWDAAILVGVLLIIAMFALFYHIMVEDAIADGTYCDNYEVDWDIKPKRKRGE